jgi:S1-C subfamily serine protease
MESGRSVTPKDSRIHSALPVALGVAAALSLVGVGFLAYSVMNPAAPSLGNPPVMDPLPKPSSPPGTSDPRERHREAVVDPLPKSPSRPGTDPRRDRPPEVVVGLGKTASACVEVSLPRQEITGTAFCIDKSGLFVTNAHVVWKLYFTQGRLRLVLNAGLESQRFVAAKMRRVDDRLDLALLKVEADPGLEPLELGNDRTLIETAPVLAFGFPLGRTMAGGGPGYPNCSVVSGRVTALHGPKERPDGIQFDGQIAPGMSGGPVLDASGRVIGVSKATIPGQSTNLAIPVGRLREFLAASGIALEPQAVSHRDRDIPVP